MIDRTVRIVSEDLARAVSRRKFLKEAGGIMFAGVCALAAGQLGRHGPSRVWMVANRRL